jgi:hypothetical protein
MRTLSRAVLAIAMAAFIGHSSVCQLETPQPSPKGKIEQRIGVMDVSVSYSRPSMRGRKIFGGLVPFNQEWRTGANNPTTISFSDNVKLEGRELAAGTYALFTIPGEQEWTIIINKNSSGNTPRDPKDDLVTFTAKPMASATLIETFTINLTDLGMNSANLELAWEQTIVKFKMEFDVDAKVMAAIKKAMENPYSSVANTYYQSASYYFSTGKENRTALEWVNKSLELNNKPYWVWRLKSQIQAAMKDYKGAIASAEASKARAKEAGNEQFVRFNDEAIAEWKAMK